MKSLNQVNTHHLNFNNKIEKKIIKARPIQV